MRTHRGPLLVALSCFLVCPEESAARDQVPGWRQKEGDLGQSLVTAGSSETPAPPPSDTLFVVDVGPDLDTGCTHRSGGPLNFTINIGRVVRNGLTTRTLAEMRAAGQITDAVLEIMAFDVDSASGERDRVSINGHIVPGEFLSGSPEPWTRSTFQIPIEWLNFPDEPDHDGTPTPAANVIQIDIDTENTVDVWCTGVDWAALHFTAARPLILVHGTPAGPFVWNGTWSNELNTRGIPFSTQIPIFPLFGSIEQGAGAVRDEVVNSKRRWGVEKVRLVGHSKGGLDARHYAEWHDDVDGVIQVGAPNGGIALSVWSQKQLALLRKAGKAVATFASLINPAIPELRPDEMLKYNDTHRRKNPKVTYTALAADYSGTDLRWNFLIDRTGRPGDGIVSTASAFGLPFGVNEVLFQSPTEDALHWELTSAQGVFNLLEESATELGLAASHAATDSVLLAEGISIGEDTQQGQSHVHTIQLDDSTETYFTVAYPSGNLNLTLTSPSSEVFDSTAVIGNPDVARDEGDFLNGKLEMFRFTKPEIGAWTVEVSAPSVTDPSGTMAYIVNTFLRNPAITVEASVSSPQILVGDPLAFFARLRRGGQPILGAAVTGDVMRPDSTVQTINLLDLGAFPDSAAGDGIYSAQYVSTSLPGDYHALVTAARSGIVGEPDFVREGSVAASASAPTSSFQGSLSDHGQDTNGNGTFDRLQVDVGLSILASGRYRVVGTLSDFQNHQQDAQAEADLTPGPQALTLNFNGATLRSNQIDGPYTLGGVALLEIDGQEIRPLDWVEGTYQTAAYAYTAFEPSAQPLYITGTFAYDDSLLGTNRTLPWGMVVAYDTKDKCAGCDSTTLDSVGVSVIDEVSHRFVIGPIANVDLNDDFGLLDLQVRVQYQTDLGFGLGWLVTLVDSTGSRWHSDYPVQQDVATDTLDLGELKPTDHPGRAALHLCRVLEGRAWDGAFESSEPITGLRVAWSPGYSKYPGQKGTIYDPTSQTLYVDGRLDSTTYSPDEWDDVVVLREFAHHVAWNLNVLAGGQASHVACPAAVADSLAWNEGFARFYAGYVQTLRGRDSSYVDVGVDPSGATNRLTVNLEDGCITPACPSGCLNGAGPGNEVSVGGALWDLYDAVNDNPGGDAFGDSIANNGSSILFWISARRPFIRTIQDFMDYYIAQTAPQNQNFRRNWLVRQVFYEHGIGYTLSGADEASAPPRVLTLYPSRPNPFNPFTRISFGLPLSSRVRLTIFDIQGRRVRSLLDQVMPLGVHEATWDGRGQNGRRVASGVYYCRLDTPSGKRSIKLVLAR